MSAKYYLRPRFTGVRWSKVILRLKPIRAKQPCPDMTGVRSLGVRSSEGLLYIGSRIRHQIRSNGRHPFSVGHSNHLPPTHCVKPSTAQHFAPI